jgi:hypothetical protein
MFTGERRRRGRNFLKIYIKFFGGKIFTSTRVVFRSKKIFEM